MSGSRIAPASLEASAGANGGEGLLRRAEVRDVLAWLRLLVDPQDASAVVRALTRPPIELRQVDLARVIQVARRRKLDLVLGLGAATESPQVPPEARERIKRFVELHRAACGELDSLAPDTFLASLIDRLAAPGRVLLSSDDVLQQQIGLQALRDLAAAFVRERPDAGSRELARHLATVAPRGRRRGAADEPTSEPVGAQPDRDGEEPAGAGEPARHAQAGAVEEHGPERADPAAGLLLHTLQLLRAELLEGVARIGGRLGELRLDTDLDISHGIVRYLELLKISALLQRPEGESLHEALQDINVRLLAAATPLQREILLTSSLDETLLAADGAGTLGAHAIGPVEERSLAPFLPRKGAGLALSASDIQAYRECPLRYKFARVLRIPSEPTLHQRFGIVVHQVLERYHADSGESLAQLLALLDAVWRRSGLGDGEHERELREKARAALTRYHGRLHEQDARPVWFERQFSFRLGPHHLRGRVDRVDRLAGEEEEYELIDYKTSHPKTAEQLREDVQLSLYALAAREDWRLPASRQAYYYVLDDLKVPVPHAEPDAETVTQLVLEVGEGILAQAFEPTPSPEACRLCDYRIVCPAAEA